MIFWTMAGLIVCPPELGPLPPPPCTDNPRPHTAHSTLTLTTTLHLPSSYYIAFHQLRRICRRGYSVTLACYYTWSYNELGHDSAHHNGTIIKMDMCPIMRFKFSSCLLQQNFFSGTVRLTTLQFCMKLYDTKNHFTLIFNLEIIKPHFRSIC